MKLMMIPMKGKGHEVTARNIMLEEPLEESRPLTTDPWDNAILTIDEEQENDADNENCR